MFAWTSHGTELKRFLRHRLTRAAIAVMLLIPLLYGAMYVWAFWDPTARMHNLPVALVNEDRPATSDGVTIAAGDRILDRLTHTDSLDWRLVDSATARDGVARGDYYFSVTIPADFSTNVVSLGGPSPSPAQLEVTYDDANSFLASTLGRSAMTQIRQAVSDEIGSTAVNRVLVGLSQVRSGMGNAKDGAIQLTDGLTTAGTGADRIAAGAAQLESGSARLQSGAKALRSGTATAAGAVPELTAGIDQLRSGSSQLSAGLAQLRAKEPALTQLQQALAATADPSTGAPALADGAERLAASMDRLATGARTLAAGGTAYAKAATSFAGGATTFANQTSAAVTPLSRGSAQVASGASSTASGVDASRTLVAQARALLTEGRTADADALLAKAGSTLDTTYQGATAVSAGAGQVKTGLDQLAAASAALTTGAADLTAAAQQLTTGAAQLEAGATQLSAATPQVQQLAAGSRRLADGLAQLSTQASTGIPALTTGIDQLAAGAGRLDAGVATLQSRMPSLASGLHSLAQGATQLSEGSSALHGGTSELAANAPALADGIDRLRGGADQLATGLADGQAAIAADSTQVLDARAEAIASPVRLASSSVHQAESWGEGFAPFFIALGLWVGALVTWLLLRPLSSRALMTSVNGFRMAWGSLNSALLIAAGQVFVMLTVMHFAVGLDPQHVIATILFAYLAAAAFFALQQLFQVTLGPAVGKVVIIALLMVQLASAGGTYPVETEPAFFQAVSPWMPVTYVVEGLRATLTGELDARFWTATAILGAIFVVSLALTSIASARKRVWTMSRLHPVLEI